MTDERNTFINNGWKQFAVLHPNDHELLLQFAHFEPKEQDLLIVISQTCDLVNSISKEPYFEIACLRSLERKPSNENSNGKNSRRFELTLNVNGVKNNYFLLAHERCFTPHKLLIDLKPHTVIKDELILDKLIGWITARYNRTAFPDKFDQRWKKRQKRIEKAIKKLKLIEDIYIRLSPFDELTKNEEYNLDILLLMDPEHFDNAETYKEYKAYRKNLEDSFEQCEGINIESVDLESTAGITLKEIQEYARWDYSYLSYRNPEEHAFSK